MNVVKAGELVLPFGEHDLGEAVFAPTLELETVIGLFRELSGRLHALALVEGEEARLNLPEAWPEEEDPEKEHALGPEDGAIPRARREEQGREGHEAHGKGDHARDAHAPQGRLKHKVREGCAEEVRGVTCMRPPRRAVPAGTRRTR